MKKVLLVCLGGLFLLSGCSSSDAPSCSSSDVKDLVLEISVEEMQKSLFYRFGRGASEMYEKVKSNNFDDIKENEKASWIKLREQYDSINNLTSDLILDSIRTSKVDDKLLKSTCEGNLNLNGKSFNITYDAQITDSGDLYVNVYGFY